MGVTGLQTYLLQNPQACYDVDISKLVEEYKRTTGKTDVTIVASGNAIKTLLYQDLNWVCGGQYKEFKASIERFVAAFQSIGVHLVIFFEAATTDQKRQIWVDRRVRQMGEVTSLFRHLRAGRFDENNESLVIPTNLGMYEQYALKMFCNCDVRSALGECDEEIAEFGRANNCFAYIGCDSDFVIYNSFHHFIWTQELNVKTMTGKKFDTVGLANSLRIPQIQLPVFATLSGNDHLNVVRDLKPFHTTLLRQQRPRSTKPYRMAVLQAVADYVRRLPQGDDLYRHLPVVSQQVFRTGSRANDLERSIRSYLPAPKPAAGKETSEPPIPSSDWEEIVFKAKELFIFGEVRTIYNTLMKKPYQMSSALEDFDGHNDLPMTAILYMPLRKRVYGILLHQRPNGPGKVEEWCCTGVRSITEAKYVEPTSPPEDLHPGLLALWGEGNEEGALDSEDLVDIRWKLFAHTVSPSLDVDALRSLVADELSHLIIPTMILKYLREAMPREGQQYLANWELKALAVQAVLLTSTDPSRVTVPMPYDVRGIQIATIFMRGVSQMLMLLASCGFPIAMKEAMPWLYFDGKLFHEKYLGLRNGRHVESLCINQDGNSLMQEFLRVKSIAGLGSA